MNIVTDAIGRAETVVTEALIARTVGSGLLPVYATPSMVALMEEAACLALAPLLAEGETTVGVSIHVEHLAATGIGETVAAEAQLTEMTARKAVFVITATCGDMVIGTATHTRIAVDSEAFMAKVAQG